MGDTDSTLVHNDVFLPSSAVVQATIPTLTISAPDQDLVEAGYDDHQVETDGISTASAALSITANASLVPDGSWNAAGNGKYTEDETYGYVVLDTVAKTLTYRLDNNLPAVQLLQVSDTFTDNVAVSLANGATAQAIFTLHGTNDKPAIRSSSSSNAGGQIDVTDPDRGSTVLLSVRGGTSTYVPEPFHFTADSFSITRNGNAYFSDDFSDGNPPPSAPNFASGTAASYNVTGQPTEADGKLVLDSTAGGSLSPIGSTNPLSGIFTTLRSNTDQSSPNGLKESATFAVTGVFDLTLPSRVGQQYGIYLDDDTSTHPGNDDIQFRVRTYSDGTYLEIESLDEITNTAFDGDFTYLGLTSPGDQIALHLTHATAGSDAITASYEIINNGVVGATQTFSDPVHIFRGENFTRAGINAYGPVDTDSSLAGRYGTLHVNQFGAYTYTLNPNAALKAGRVGEDTFTLVATDEEGASITREVQFNLKGTETGGTNVSSATVGTVSDGRVAAATVFADANNNGVLDSGEASTITDAQGQYALVGGSGSLVAFGGTDIGTGKPLTVTLEAPSGSTVITPLTTLIEALGGTDDAAGEVAAAFGISSNIDLTGYDPVAGVASGDLDANAAYLANVAVGNTAELIAAALGGEARASRIGAAVFAALAKDIGALAQGAALDLTDAPFLTSLVTDVASNIGISFDGQAVATIVGQVAASNAADAADTRPVANPDTGFTVTENTSLMIPLAVLLANDTDADHDPLHVTAVSADDGSVVLDRHGNVVFTPTTGFTGPVQLLYEINDGHPGGSASGQVSITVTPPDTTPPTALLLFENPDLSGGETTTLTAQFSEAVMGFTLDDLVAIDGSFNDFQEVNAQTYTALFTPDANRFGQGGVTLAAGSYTDLAGNPGAGSAQAAFLAPAGFNVINGDRLSNTIAGTSGRDTIFGRNGSDTIVGGDGDDYIDGGNQSDNLSGGAGNDTLVGGSGRDMLSGGSGADLFVFGTPTEGGKQIADFTHGEDHIGLTAAGFGFDSLSDFDLVSGRAPKAVSTAPTLLYFSQSGLLQYDADGAGAGKAVYFATLTGHPTLDKSDFTIV